MIVVIYHIISEKKHKKRQEIDRQVRERKKQKYNQLVNAESTLFNDSVKSLGAISKSYQFYEENPDFDVPIKEFKDFVKNVYFGYLNYKKKSFQKALDSYKKCALIIFNLISELKRKSTDLIIREETFKSIDTGWHDASWSGWDVISSYQSEIKSIKRDLSRKEKYSKIILEIYSLHKILQKVNDIENYLSYDKYISLFVSNYEKRTYNAAINYYLRANQHKMSINDKKAYLNDKIEEKQKIAFRIIILSLTAKIKKEVLDLATKFTRLEIREISEKCNVDNEDLIIEVVQNMINNKEIYAEYFTSSKSISFNQQANIEDIDRLMATYKDWEEKQIEKKDFEKVENKEDLWEI